MKSITSLDALHCDHSIRAFLFIFSHRVRSTFMWLPPSQLCQTLSCQTACSKPGQSKTSPNKMNHSIKTRPRSQVWTCQDADIVCGRGILQAAMFTTTHTFSIRIKSCWNLIKRQEGQRHPVVEPVNSNWALHMEENASTLHIMQIKKPQVIAANNSSWDLEGHRWADSMLAWRC